MDVQEIAAGLWRWTGWHEEWRQEVGSVYIEAPDAVVLIDPLVPPEDTERFWQALDRDVERSARPVHVLVTVYWHTRSAHKLAERYDARVWASSRVRAAIERRAGRVTDVFRVGDELPGGVDALPTARGGELVYWLPEHRALVPGDVLLGAPGGAVVMCPESWLPTAAGHAELAASLRPLLDLPVERILVSHGRPILEAAGDALRAALARGPHGTTPSSSSEVRSSSASR